MRTIQVKNLIQLMQQLETYLNGQWVFRGESKDTYNLQPSIGRPGARKHDNGSNAAFSHDAEKKSLKKFRSAAAPHLKETQLSDLEYLTLAQHHGLPTRLLDWSENPLVAAYFAVKNMGHGKSTGVIYAIPRPAAVTKTDWLKPFSVSAVRLVEPRHWSPRITAQKSLFTIHPRPDEVFSPINLNKILIGPKYCGKIKSLLDNLGFNLASLFPDLDGVAKAISWQYKWRKL